jgi:hypothetical protein
MPWVGWITCAFWFWFVLRLVWNPSLESGLLLPMFMLAFLVVSVAELSRRKDSQEEAVTALMRIRLMVIGIVFGGITAIGKFFFNPSRKDAIWFGWLIVFLIFSTVAGSFCDSREKRRERAEARLNDILKRLERLEKRVGVGEEDSETDDIVNG